MNLTAQDQNTIFDFKLKTIDGNDFDMSTIKGKKVMIVNVASKCGLTPQYEQLQQLYEKYGNEKFIILGFPANNFAKQEPGTDEDIKQFCTSNYGVSFPMFSKISVKGKDMHPLYEWLTKKELNGKEDVEVKWNFQKFLINEKGEWVESISPQTDPLDKKIVNWITGN